MKTILEEDGCSNTSGEAYGHAPENMIALVSLEKRLESAVKRWSGTSLQERTNEAAKRWLNETTWTSRIEVSDVGKPTDYEKARTKRIKDQVKGHEEAFVASRNDPSLGLNDADYLDDQVDEFLRDYLQRSK